MAGDDAIYCDGLCNAWLHRGCAGLSGAVFKSVIAAPKQTPFYCPHCRIFQMEKEISSLKSVVDTLVKESSVHTPVIVELRSAVESIKSKLDSPHYWTSQCQLSEA